MELLRRARRIPSRVALAFNRREYQRRPRSVLSTAQRTFWEENGYLILERHFSLDRVDALNRCVDEVWADSRRHRRPTVADIFIDSPQERRTLLSDAPLEARKAPHKINDLFLESELIRETILETRLSLLLEELLGAPPLVCNSLNLEFGSQQADHCDSIYMSAPVKQYLAATWIALEDCSPDAGPLRFYPGSHKIPPYRFSNGSTAAIYEEMPEYASRMATELARRGLEPEIFLAKAGDVLVWHSQLFHGGETIRDPSRTRRSLVTHYWRARDLRLDHGKVGPGRYYLNRSPQQVPGSPS